MPSPLYSKAPPSYQCQWCCACMRMTSWFKELPSTIPNLVGFVLAVEDWLDNMLNVGRLAIASKGIQQQIVFPLLKAFCESLGVHAGGAALVKCMGLKHAGSLTLLTGVAKVC